MPCVSAVRNAHWVRSAEYQQSPRSAHLQLQCLVRHGHRTPYMALAFLGVLITPADPAAIIIRAALSRCSGFEERISRKIESEQAERVRITCVVHVVEIVFPIVDSDALFLAPAAANSACTNKRAERVKSAPTQ
ncbi:hypothetical protein MRX96_055104 [Rhipicephalus microplus]